jgi:hypothetical protein
VPRPSTSSLNWSAGSTAPNLAQLALGTSGKVTAWNAIGSTDVLVDVAGYFSAPAASPGAAGLYNPLTPTRILDTRWNNQPLGQNATLNLPVAGQGYVPPAGASAVVLNVTAASPTAPSWLTVYPFGAVRPNASNLNFRAGQTVPNRVIVQLGKNSQSVTPGGWISISNAYGSVHVIVDVAGWFTDGSPGPSGTSFVGITPTRILDTRNGTGNIYTPFGPNSSASIRVGSIVGVPSGAKAVVLNVTVTDTSQGSWLTVWPEGVAEPNSSDLNWSPGVTVANMVVVQVNGDRIDIGNALGSVDVLVDAVGWYG